MSETHAKPRGLHWIALALLCISVCINYADRGNVGVAGTSLERELFLSPKELGVLMAAFSVTYAFAQIVTAKLFDRWNVNWLYALAFLLWSAATCVTGLANTFGQILALRLLLGISESVAYPAYSKMMVVTFPESLRGTANGLIDAGSKLGPAIGVYLGVLIINWYNWRGMFIIIGGASLLWLIPWCSIASKLPSEVVTKNTAQPLQSASYAQLLRSKTMWGTSIGLFGGNYAWYFLLNWIPYYYERERHYTHDRLAIFGSLPFVVIAISSASLGFAADALIRRGNEAGALRQRFMCVGLLLSCGFMFAAIRVKDDLLSNVLLMLGCLAMGAWSSNHWALSQLLAGPATAGKWTALQNCVGNIAGIVAPSVTGYILSVTHTFFAGFAIACGLCIVSVIGYWFVVGKPKQVFGLQPATERIPETAGA